MIANWNYLKYVIAHKYYVLYAGVKWTKAPLWQLLIHDASKFGKTEWGPYVRRFYAKRDNEMDHARDKEEWLLAWHHHWHHNPHHWEYWTTARGSALDMPERYMREMVADWCGAGKAKTGSWDIKKWYMANGSSMKLSRNTRNFVEKLLEEAWDQID